MNYIYATRIGDMSGNGIFSDPEMEEIVMELFEQYKDNEEPDSELLDEFIGRLLDDPLTKEMLQAGIKRRWVDQHLIEGIGIEEQYTLMQSILHLSFMPYEEEIEGYMEKEEVKEIYSKVETDFEENTVSEELHDLYEQNLTPVY